jgi:hypothetical protein
MKSDFSSNPMKATANLAFSNWEKKLYFLTVLSGLNSDLSRYSRLLPMPQILL